MTYINTRNDSTIVGNEKVNRTGRELNGFVCIGPVAEDWRNTSHWIWRRTCGVIRKVEAGHENSILRKTQCRCPKCRAERKADRELQT